MKKVLFKVGLAVLVSVNLVALSACAKKADDPLPATTTATAATGATPPAKLSIVTPK